jgi:hypothetical protein
MSLYLKISARNHMVFLTFPFSSFFHSITHPPYTLFHLGQYFWWWFTLKRYLCYTLYIVKGKENSKEFVWQIIMVDGEWCGSWGGKKGKSQGNEDSANANDMWVWVKPQIGFCTIGKCDLLSYFISIKSLPAACKSHPLFLFSF